MKPRAVVFDLGNVLLDFDYGKVARAMLHHCRLPEEDLRRVLDQSPLLFRYETGLLTTLEFFEEVRRASEFRCSLEEFKPMFADIFTPVLEMIELNRRLRAANVPTCIFSNTNEIAIEHIRDRYPFFAEFSDYVLSYEHNSMKPHPRIYEVVEERSRLRGPELLYLDDRLENVEQARKRGWNGIHHSHPARTVPLVEAAFHLTTV